MNSTELAAQFLRGKKSVRLTVRQASWLADLIVRETKAPGRAKIMTLPGNPNPEEAPIGYMLATYPNGAGLLKPYVATT